LRGSFDYWIVKIDSLGNTIWDKDFGGSAYDKPENIVETLDKGYLMSGVSWSSAGGDKTQNNLGGVQGWFIKTDSLGNKQWDRTILTTGQDYWSYSIQSKDGCYVFAVRTQAGYSCDKTFPLLSNNSNYSFPDYWIIKFCDTTSHCDLFLPLIRINGDTLNIYNGVSYQWYLNGNIISGAIDSFYIINQSGSYTVEVTDINGCMAFSNPIVISSIDAIQNPQFNIFPNPATTELNIQIDETLLGAQLNIYNITGALMQTATLDIQHSAFNIQQFPSGVYIAEINPPAGRAGTKEASVKRRWIKM